MARRSVKSFILICLLGMLLGTVSTLVVQEVWSRFGGSLWRLVDKRTWQSREARILEFPTVVVKVSSMTAVLGAPYQEGFVKVVCKGMMEFPDRSFVAVIRCKEKNEITRAALLWPGMRLRLHMVPYENAPQEVRKGATADDIEDFSLPQFWVTSFEHESRDVSMISDVTRAQWVGRLPETVVKSAISIPCGDTGSPFYFFGGDWGLYAPQAGALLASTGAGSVRRALQCMDRELKKRDIRLIVVPVPQPSSLYPDVALGRFEGQVLKSKAANTAMPEFLRLLNEDGILAFDLTAYFSTCRTYSHEGLLYPAWSPVDTHWSSWACGETARIIAEKISQERMLGDELGARIPKEKFRVEWNPEMCAGDIGQIDVVRRLGIKPEPVPSVRLQVKAQGDDGQRVLDDDSPEAPVHLVGDSNLLAGQEDNSGLRAHLVKSLGVPVHVVAAGGGGRATAPKAWLADCQSARPKVMIWVFAEREVTRGGWYCAGRFP